MDTADLDAAKVKLVGLVTAAKAAEAATKGFGAAAAGIGASSKGAAGGIGSFSGAVGQAASGAGSATKSILAVGTAMGAVQRAAIAAAAPIKVMNMAAQQFGPPTAAWEAYVAALGKVPAAATGAKSSLDRLGKAANDNINRLQSTPGNIAAQFQDIGVTAAGGMNPLLIGLQQGTQLSAAFANGLKDIGPALAQVFGPVALLTIGMVALIAALIQAVNWISVAKSALYGLADAMVAVAPYAVALGAVMLVAFGPQIIAAIGTFAVFIVTTLVSAIGAATSAMIAFALANPFTAIVLAIGLAGVAIYGLSQIFGGVFSDIVKGVRDAVNFLIGSFVGAYNGIVATWSKLPSAIGDVAYQAANLSIRAIEILVNGSIELINGLIARVNAATGLTIGTLGKVSFGDVGNPYPGAAKEFNDTAVAAIKAGRAVDYVGGGMKFIRDTAASAAKFVKGFADGIGGKGDKAKGTGGGKAKGASGGKTDGAKFEDIVQGGQNDIATEISRGEAITRTAEAAATLAQNTKLLNQANTQGIKLTDPMRAAIDQLSAAYGKAKVEADRAIATRELTRASQADLDNLKQEASLIGLYGRELIYATEYAKQFAAAKAKFANDDVGLKEFAKGIPASAGAIADETVKINKLKFMEQMRRESEMTQFELQREAGAIGLSNQALIAYNMTTDRLLQAKRQARDLSLPEIAAIEAESAAYAAKSAAINNTRDALDFARESVKGFVSDLRGGLEQGKSFFSAFGDAVLNVLNKVLDKLVDVALDAAFSGKKSSGNDGVSGLISGIVSLFTGGKTKKFARGGTFTNSIVDSPTLFKFAKGTGMMGEAGPEAIMPLKRGSDGSLGVQMNGSRGASNDNRAAPVVNINNSYVISGAVSSTEIQASIRQSAEQTKDQLRREIPQVLTEYQHTGTGPV